MSTRPSIRQIDRAGFRAIADYPRMSVALYAIQLTMSVLAGVVAWRAMIAAFGDREILELASRGDVLALVIALRDHAATVAATLWSTMVLVAAYGMLSWLTTAGFLSVLVRAPDSRTETMEVFGAGGVAAFPGFLRLWLWCLIPYAVAGFALMMGLGYGLSDAADHLTVGGLLGKLLPALTPGLILWWIVNTAVDFARIELVTRERKRALGALLRGFATVFTDWRPLPHAASYYLIWIAVGAAYSAGTAGVAISAGALLLLRQTVAIIRFAAKLWLHGGQVAYRTPRPD